MHQKCIMEEITICLQFKSLITLKISPCICTTRYCYFLVKSRLTILLISFSLFGIRNTKGPQYNCNVVRGD